MALKGPLNVDRFHSVLTKTQEEDMKKVLYSIAAMAAIFAAQPASANCVQLFTQNGGWWAHNGCGHTVTIRVFSNGEAIGDVNAPNGRNAILGLGASNQINIRWCNGFGCNPG